MSPDPKAEERSPDFKKSPASVLPTTPTQSSHMARSIPASAPPPHPHPHQYHQHPPPSYHSSLYQQHHPHPQHARQPSEDYRQYPPHYLHYPHHGPSPHGQYPSNPDQQQPLPPPTPNGTQPGAHPPPPPPPPPPGSRSNSDSTMSVGSTVPQMAPQPHGYSDLVSMSFEMFTPSTMSNPPAGARTFPCTCPAVPKIPRPRNAFILYRQNRQQEVSHSNPGLPNPEISKIIGDNWKKETEEVKNQFKLLAEEEKLEHQRKHPDYRYQPKRAIKPGQRSDDHRARCGKCGGIITSGSNSSIPRGGPPPPNPRDSTRSNDPRTLPDGPPRPYSHHRQSASVGSRGDYYYDMDEDDGMGASPDGGPSKRRRYNDGSYTSGYNGPHSAHAGTYGYPSEFHGRNIHPPSNFVGSTSENRGHRASISGPYSARSSYGYQSSHYPPPPPPPPPPSAYPQSAHPSQQGPLPPPDIGSSSDRRAFSSNDLNSPLRRRQYPAMSEYGRPHSYGSGPVSPQTPAHSSLHAPFSGTRQHEQPGPSLHLAFPPPLQRPSISQPRPEELKLPPLQTQFPRSDGPVQQESRRLASEVQDCTPHFTKSAPQQTAPVGALEREWRNDMEGARNGALKSLQDLSRFHDLNARAQSLQVMQNFMGGRSRGTFIAIDGIAPDKMLRDVSSRVHSALDGLDGIEMQPFEYPFPHDNDQEDVVMSDAPGSEQMLNEKLDERQLWERLCEFLRMWESINGHITSTANDSPPRLYPVALVKNSFRLYMLDWLAQRMEVMSFNSFESTYAWIEASLARVPQPDLTVLIRPIAPNLPSDSPAVVMDQAHRTMVVHVEHGVAIPESTLRRVGFEVEEFMRSILPRLRESALAA